MRTLLHDPDHTKRKPALRILSALAALLPISNLVQGQTSADPSAGNRPDDEETVLLSPFVVDATRDRGYAASSTLAGTRIRTDLKDVGSSISVITKEMLTDLGATNNETVLAYALNTEVSGPRGNFVNADKIVGNSEQLLFANPNASTRVRGLTDADNTRNYFRTDIPWDGYTVNRVDLLRGPNAILFGLGKAGGVVNATTNDAQFTNKGRFEATFDNHDSQRYVLDYNRQLLPNELALRISLLRNSQKFQQDPAFSLDQRAYAAVKYKPAVLNHGATRFEVTGNFEHGEINSNRPRFVTPTDNVSQYWKPIDQGGLGKQVFNPYTYPRLTDSASANYVPTLLSTVTSNDVSWLINSNGSTTWLKEGIDAYGARRLSDGSIINAIQDSDAVANLTNGPWLQQQSFRRVRATTFNEWAGNKQLPYSGFGAYHAENITDTSVYDYFHKLLDGPNKREWTDWNAGEVHLTNTFLGDALGYDLGYFKQRLKRGQWGALSWDNTIIMDVNSKLSDGTNNPDVGRAYINLENRTDGNQRSFSDRKAWRAQLFGNYDFSKKNDAWWARILGEHRLTGVASREDEKSDTRQRKYFAMDPESMARFTPDPNVFGATNNNQMNTSFRYYLSGDLRGQSSAAGSNISNMAMPFMPNAGGPITVRRFDNTWIAGDMVNPTAYWANPADPRPEYITNTSGQQELNPGRYRQSQNPANYKGWTNTPANIITLDSHQTINGMSSEDYLTYSGSLRDFTVESKVLVWQGYFWDKAIVGTYGYREDEARLFTFQKGSQYGNALYGTKGPANLDPSVYNFDNPKGTINTLETITRNWSVAAHLNRLLGKHDFLPINVSLYYNSGENFEPAAGRLDAFGHQLAPPQGKTKEYSVLLATKDSKFSLRVTKYETDVYNNTFTGDRSFFFALEQSLNEGSKNARNFRSGTWTPAQYSELPALQTKLVNSILPTWFKMEKDLVTQFPDWAKYWTDPGAPFGTDSNTITNSFHSTPGFEFTEDSHSKGYEFEFTANPTSNWRIAANASKTQAYRDNAPGAAYLEVANFVDNAIMKTDAGLVPIWWSGNNETNSGGLRGFTYGPIYHTGLLKLQTLNGKSANEIREWRANLITNYRFSEGTIKGLGVGGGYRWEDKAVIDYAPMKDAGGTFRPNLNAPFFKPSRSTVDLWLSYDRKIAHDVLWRIQLNVYNVFGKNELEPFSVSVDYEKLAAAGITKDSQLTPTTVVPMKPTAFTLREGRSWQITNTFEF